jgi:DNA-binding LytR/AlgR family response regulator
VKALQVGIVEDEMIIAEDMKDILVRLGYEVPFIAVTGEEARHELQKNETDILLVDIRIKGSESGIELARFVHQQYRIPFIYVTSNADKATVAEAKQTFPYGYLLKPFDERDLFAAIEIAISNFKQQQSTGNGTETPENDNFVVNDSIFVRDKKFFLKLKFADILYLEASGNYTTIHTSQKKITLRSTLKEIEPKLPVQQFVRIHKSYIIRWEALSGINAQFVLVKDAELPIGRTYHELISSRINKLSS